MIKALFSLSALAPIALMVLAALMTRLEHLSTAAVWRMYQALSSGALVMTIVSVWVGPGGLQLPAVLHGSLLGLTLAIMVQLLGTVIGSFSSRYLQGEEGQERYVAALATVLASVHLLLLADHWAVLITAWALVGIALQHLLCFYPERPFAMLAAHKKWMADRAADGLLVGAAALVWTVVGSGHLPDLWLYLGREGMTPTLHLSALMLVSAVIVRTAVLPVHGWLIQVMEAPTPVSALLHAGVVNLGGFVLIRFAPLLERAMPARALLFAFGLASTVLAGLVMLTRISIKVRLAWSTVAQMGFMLLECALGLYTLAALHMIGHSLYKAQAFLSASTVVRQTRLWSLHCPSPPATLGLAVAPVLTITMVLLIQSQYGHTSWPWWWSVLLGLAWAPLLWVPDPAAGPWALGAQVLFGALAVVGLTGVALLAHALPLGVQDAPQHGLGLLALLAMAMLYLALTLLRLRPQTVSGLRRWSYAGFYVDEAYTRLVLRVWPTRWTPEGSDTHFSVPEPPRRLLVDAGDGLPEGRSR